MTTSIHDRVIAVLSEHNDPYLETNLGRNGALNRCELDDGELLVELTFPYPLAGATRTLIGQLKPMLEGINEVREAFIRVRHEVLSPPRVRVRNPYWVFGRCFVWLRVKVVWEVDNSGESRSGIAGRGRTCRTFRCGYLWALPGRDAWGSGSTS